MNPQINLRQPTLTTEAINDLVIDSIQDIKGKNIIKLDLRQLDEAPTDFFIICEGDSNTHVKAIADKVQKRLKMEGGVLPNHVEGERVARWVLIDYFSTVIHVFHPEARNYYELEQLWSDAKMTEYNSL